MTRIQKIMHSHFEKDVLFKCRMYAQVIEGKLKLPKPR